MAEVSRTIAGLQTQEWNDPNWPGPDGLAADLAMIAGDIDSDFQWYGIGKALFAKILAAALSADARHIDATIHADKQGASRFTNRLVLTITAGYGTYPCRVAHLWIGFSKRK